MTNVARDVLWERALASLPPPLLVALRSAGLNPSVLVEYPRNTQEELECGLGRTLVGLDALAPSGATSSSQRTDTYGHSLPVLALEWPGVASGSGVVKETGGDPKTVQFVPSGGEVKTDHTGGDPRTVPFVPSGGEVKTDHTGGDPKTDQASFVCETLTDVGMAATCPPYRLGRLASATAMSSDPVPTAVLDFSVGSADPDEFSTVAACDELLDGFPSISEDLDGLLRCESTVFTPILHISENSERLRESDFGVQIVPACGSPSELSAHQMGLSLAGTTRLKTEPTAPTGILNIEEPINMSIADRVLRRFNTSEQGKEVSQNSASFEQEDSKTVSRVDGYPQEQSMSLFDRMLLRKYPDAATKTIPSISSSMASAPPVAHSGGSVKKRRRFYVNGKSDKANVGAVARNEESPDHGGSPCGFTSKVVEPPVHSGPAISQSIPVSGLFDFTLLYYTLVLDNAIPLGYLEDFRSLEAPTRRAVKRLQTHAASISDSMASTALSALRRESELRESLENSIADQMVIAADTRPKRFRTKWQRAVYDGPTARKDAESAERDRWIHLLRSTDTPMGKLIKENPSNIQLLGGGRRAGTLRSRVRSVQKFLGWLVASHGISFPTHWRHLTEYLQVRYSEPCVRGSLKLVHSSYIFLQEVAGIEDKLTDSAMYAVSLKELVSQAAPGRSPRQAPRFPTILLASFEEMVLASDRPLFLRVLSWWLLVQSWGTMRFDDHRGLLP